MAWNPALSDDACLIARSDVAPGAAAGTDPPPRTCRAAAIRYASFVRTSEPSTAVKARRTRPLATSLARCTPQRVLQHDVGQADPSRVPAAPRHRETVARSPAPFTCSVEGERRGTASVQQFLGPRQAHDRLRVAHSVLLRGPGRIRAPRGMTAEILRHRRRTITIAAGHRHRVHLTGQGRAARRATKPARSRPIGNSGKLHEEVMLHSGRTAPHTGGAARATAQRPIGVTTRLRPPFQSVDWQRRCGRAECRR